MNSRRANKFIEDLASSFLCHADIHRQYGTKDAAKNQSKLVYSVLKNIIILPFCLLFHLQYATLEWMSFQK
jgi:hypothetical protein